MKWVDALVLPKDVVREIRAEADDGYQLAARKVSANGPRGGEPFIVTVRAIRPDPIDGEDPLPFRLPTTPELITACDELIGAGALMAMVFPTVDPKDRDGEVTPRVAAGGTSLSQQPIVQAQGAIGTNPAGLVPA